MPLSLDAAAAGAVSEAENSIQALNAEAHPALAPLARLLLRTESIASSKVEGMQLGARELARAEARAETDGKASQTAMEILSNIDAMEVAVEEAAMVKHFGINEITSIHHRLTEKATHPRIAGRVRTEQNWIGGNDYNPCGADFVPPPPDKIRALLTDLCDAVNDDRLPPIVQAALVHAQFETIHPFDDGNGRAGRALIHVVLRRRGIAPAYVPPISVALAGARDRYIEGLMGFREERVIDWGCLPAHPIITAPVAAAVTHRAKAAIYQALSELQDAGVLVPLSPSRRNQSWEAVGLLDLLAGLEAGRFPKLVSPSHAGLTNRRR